MRTSFADTPAAVIVIVAAADGALGLELHPRINATRSKTIRRKPGF